MIQLAQRLQAQLGRQSKRVDWLGPALARITVGVVFLTSGWGKVHNLEQVTAFFTELHLPAPMFQAVLVSLTELVGGAALLAGLGTRLAAAPLAVTMTVAILTAKREELTSFSSLVGLSEFAYLVLLLWLVAVGAGRLSLDAWIARRLAGAPIDTARYPMGSAQVA